VTLSFVDSWVTPDQLEDWPLPGSPHFARSRAYEIFLRELRRYTLEEIGGRSFLIAGHRGAGKTALVAQALRQLSTEMLQASIDPVTRTVSRRGRLQRPLIINLAAQSLVTPPAPPAKAKPKPQTKDGEGEDEDDAVGEQAKADEKPLDEVGSALVHITIALYRALAREVARGSFVAASPNHGHVQACAERQGRAGEGHGLRDHLAAQAIRGLRSQEEPDRLTGSVENADGDRELVFVG